MLVWLPSKLDMCIEACRELLRAYERKVDLGHASLSDVVYATSELASIEIEWDTIETWLKGLDQAA
ncbi:MAG: hypothetical protein HONBIEJF_02321 [Fimbriimonadaceae bacterium]|nr:hypothetical protein [Fimbriimonadaceae bacterium]